MNKVDWIKLDVNMYKNRKVRLLRRRTGGGVEAVYIWAALLMIAGQSNAGGRLMLSRTLPFTPETLAEEIELPEETVKAALKELMALEMVKKRKNVLEIADWENHQNEEKLAQMREAARLRQQRYRARKKEQEQSAMKGEEVESGEDL